MPIVDVEWVSDSSVPAEVVRSVADELGQVFGSEPGRTWVRVRTLSTTQYAENDVAEAPRPAFVHVLMSLQPTGDAAAELARRITHCVAEQLDLPADRVHVLFSPGGAGRIAFGGELRR